MRVEIPADLYALGDAPLLTRLFGNLLENAARYAASTSTVTARINGRVVAVIVEDDGPGVPAELGGQIFDRFFHGPESPGSGLGLSLALWIARAHQGDIRWLGSSRFEVTLPLANRVERRSEA